MRIQMKQLAAGPGGPRHPGRTYDVPDAEGQSLIEGGAAVAIAPRPAAPAAKSAEPVETADAPTPDDVETATSRTAGAPAGRGRRTRG